MWHIGIGRAPSNDSSNQYSNLSLEDLIKECNLRKLDISKANVADDYIKLLFKDDNPPTDWGNVYCRVLYHTGMGYEEVERRTIPQIEAILKGAGENISIKYGIPFTSSMSNDNGTPKEVDNDTKLAQVDQFLKMFNK